VGSHPGPLPRTRRTSVSAPAAARHADASAIFGGATLDLREAHIDAFALFGGVDVLVLEGWRASVSGLPFMGGIAALVLMALAYAGWRAVVALLIPLAVALLLAALLWPVVSWPHRHRVPRALATGLVLLTSLALLGDVPGFTVDALVIGAGGIGAASR
jgi:hypothetical protein